MCVVLTHVTDTVTLKNMIKSFRHKGLKLFFETGTTRGIQPSHAGKLGDILDFLDAATEAQDMNLPGFRLHQLTGNRQGIWSVKVSGNWRVTFRFEHGDAHVVDYEDYH